LLITSPQILRSRMNGSDSAGLGLSISQARAVTFI